MIVIGHSSWALKDTTALFTHILRKGQQTYSQKAKRSGASGGKPHGTLALHYQALEEEKKIELFNQQPEEYRTVRL